MDHLTTRRATADTLSSTIAAPVTQPATFSSSMMTASQSSAPSTLSELQSRFSQVPLAQYRLRLEQHLAVPRATPADRSYIVDRLVALANDVDLGPYTWDGGDTGNSVVSAAASAYSSGASASMRMPSTFSATATSTRTFSVASTTPSDAEILFHVFCAFMDDRMRELGVYSGARPFTTQFVVGPVTLGSAATGTEKYRGTDDAVRLHIVQRYPLKLALSHGRQQWEIYEVSTFQLRSSFTAVVSDKDLPHSYHTGP